MSTKLRVAGLLAVILAAGCGDSESKQMDARTPDRGQSDRALVSPDAPAGDAARREGGATDGPDARTLVRQQALEFVKTLAGKLPAAASGKVETYVPADNDSKGWVEDTATGKAGVEAAYDKISIEAIINGSHDPYDKEGCAGFAKQDYIQGKATLQLQLWQMSTQTGATNMQAYNKKKGEDDSGLTFQTITGVLDQAIIADDQPQWRVYGYKGVYVYKVLANYMY